MQFFFAAEHDMMNVSAGEKTETNDLKFGEDF